MIEKEDVILWREYVLRNCKFHIQNIPVILKLSDWHFILISSQWIRALFTLQIYLSRLTYPFIFIPNHSKTWDKAANIEIQFWAKTLIIREVQQMQFILINNECNIFCL